MKLICINYLCLVDRIDGGLREYYKDCIYMVNFVGDFCMVDGYPLNRKQIENNFITIYEFRNKKISDILK